MAELVIPGAPHVAQAGNALIAAADRSADDLLDKIDRHINGGMPYAELMGWIGHSLDRRKGFLLQRAVAAAISCHDRYHVDEDVVIRFPRPQAGQRRFQVDCMVFDRQRGATSVFEVTHSLRRKTPVDLAHRIDKISDLLQDRAPPCGGDWDYPMVTFVTLDPADRLHPDLDARLLTVEGLCRHLNLSAWWAIKAVMARFHYRFAQGMADVGL